MNADTRPFAPEAPGSAFETNALPAGLTDVGTSRNDVPPLAITVDRRAGHRVVVALDGDLDLAASEYAGAVIGGIVAGGARAIDIDAGGLRFVDAAGLSTLITARRRARAARASFDLIASSPALDRVLALTGTHEAVGAIGGQGVQEAAATRGAAA